MRKGGVKQMSTAQKLVQLSNDGELGRLLAEKFQGEVGHTCSRKDDDFLVVFESEDKIPEIFEIKEVIVKHYEAFGFIIDKAEISRNSLWVSIVCIESGSWTCFSVTITTHYPHGGNCNTLRATSKIL